MRKIYFALGLTVVAFSCQNECEEIKPAPNQFVFGRASEFCIPGECEKLFIIDDGKLFQGKALTSLDKKVAWSVERGAQMSWEKYGAVYPLEFKIPEALLSSSETLLGCDKCVDWSGIYIETFHDGKRKYWYITAGFEDPEIMPYVNLIYQKIAEIE
jgi:hypothetical protein